MTKIAKNYKILLQELLNIKTSANTRSRNIINAILVDTYWKIGKRIFQENLSGDEKALTLKRLSEDLQIEESVLMRATKFFALFPVENPANQYPFVSWSHYKILLSLTDKNQRLFYLMKTQKNAWPVRRLSQKIKDNAFASFDKKPGPDDASPLLSRAAEALHIYKANLHHVVDGDTLVANIDLGFDVWVQKRLRLRGIDTPEMKSPEAQEQKKAVQAKEFVKARIAEDDIIVLQTFKIDLHGRFICDIFYLTGERDKEIIYKEGNFLNQELLDSGLARQV